MQSTAQTHREVRTQVRIAHQKVRCAKCRLTLPVELVVSRKSNFGWCMFCIEKLSAARVRKLHQVLRTKVNNTIVRHSKRMHVATPVLREEYGWSCEDLLSMLISALKEPCIYCRGIRYGGEGRALGDLPLHQVSLDLYIPGKPYLANMRWCCQLCNNVKRDMDAEKWQLYCTYFPKWLRGFGEQKLRELRVEQSELGL